jgi:polysaccharide export outer membrane protein
MPPYIIEPPDVLIVEAIKLVPRAPYKLEPLDIIQVLAPPSVTLQDQPISGNFGIDPGGFIDLGPAYGRVQVRGITVEQAIERIQNHLRRILTQPQVSVTLVQSSGVQRIEGEHLVNLDGTINLGTYGKVYVAGLTVDGARERVEEHLKNFLEDPMIYVDLYEYRSKVYYVILESAQYGDQVARVPSTGNETVLDALSQVNGLKSFSSKRIWIARPAPGGLGCDQVLPVHWDGITKGGATATNYQVLPGDRIFVADDPAQRLTTAISNITAPFERIFGFSLLGAQAIQTLNRFPRGLPAGAGSGF